MIKRDGLKKRLRSLCCLCDHQLSGKLTVPSSGSLKLVQVLAVVIVERCYC